jgi:hypothetical protein
VSEHLQFPAQDLLGGRSREPKMILVCFFQELNIRGGVDPAGVEAMIPFSPECPPTGSVYQPEQLGSPVSGDLSQIRQHHSLVCPVQPMIVEAVNGAVDEAVPLCDAGGSQ